MDKYLEKRLEGRYDILELIGSGGMSNVYRAHDVIDDRMVAVKILRDEFVGNEEFIRRFKNESKAIALLNHPNIVRVFDVSFTNNIHSIVMEYIDGISLKEFIWHKKVLAPKEILHLAYQILNALQHAHDKGIIHRDIKPQNIMLLRSGQIKVTDFGIARFARREGHTLTDRAIGSVHYISPEQAMGEYTDERSDLYSVGVMLYEMLTGKLPFEAETAVSVAIKQVQNPVKAPSELNPDIPPAFEEIVLHAMEKNPVNRYQSAAEVIADLKAFQQNPAVKLGYQAKRSAALKEEEKRKQQSTKQVARKPKSRTPFLRVLFMFMLTIMVGTICFVGLMFYLDNPFTKKPEKPVENFIGTKVSDIQATYYAFVFDIGYIYDDNIPYGTVIEQRPQPGMNIRDGGTLKVVVSQGAKEITVPDYIAAPASRSIRELLDIGLKPIQSDHREFSDTIPAGTIISMEPAAGSLVKSGTDIFLVVSKGTEIVPMSVPDVRDINLESAKAQILAAGFKVGVVRTKRDTRPEGFVISQNPPPGDLQIEGMEITLVVSEGGLLVYSIDVPLPHRMNREVLFRARIGENAETIIDEATFNPAETSGDYWTVPVSGQESDELKVSIFIDKMLYQVYELDFDTGVAWLAVDLSDNEFFE